METRLRDVIAALEKRKRYHEAEYYRFIIPLQLGLLHDLSEKQVLNMTIDEIGGWFKVPRKPLKYEGWNSFYWGEAVIADSSKRNA